MSEEVEANRNQEVNKWSLDTLPEDFDSWPKPNLYFKKSIHLLKVWGFNPNNVSMHLIPHQSLNAGMYPQKGSVSQQTSRENFLREHNKCPQWLAESVFPAPYYVSKADEKFIPEMKESQSEATSVLIWLIEDFMEMFTEATGIELFWPNGLTHHVDPDYKGGVKFTKRVFQDKVQYCMYCRKLLECTQGGSCVYHIIINSGWY